MRNQKGAVTVPTGRNRGQVLCSLQWAHLYTNAGDNGSEYGDLSHGVVVADSTL
jgi:hypothetical protein